MWRSKVIIQFFLAKIPFGEKLNHWLQICNGSYSEKVTKKRIVEVTGILRELNKRIPLEGAVVVEVGTGWIPICSVLFYLFGAKACYTYDHVRHLRYERVREFLQNLGAMLDEVAEMASLSPVLLRERFSRLNSSSDIEEFLTSANIVYKAPGDASQTGLAEESVDLVYSLAVLEHVPPKVIYDLTEESKRILKKTGAAYHKIGVGDHYASRKVTKVNFLKYSEFWWSFFIQNKISYHNRLREKQFLDIFEECGARIVWKKSKIDPRDLDALKSMKINKAFQGMSHEELAVSDTELMYSFC